MYSLSLYLLAVVTIFYAWRFHRIHLKERERRLRKRVAFMLWQAAAQQDEIVEKKLVQV